MNFRVAEKLATDWPNWIRESKKKAIQKAKKDGWSTEERKNYSSLFDYGIQKAELLIPTIQWFLNCLYSKGYKIVPK